jgi:xanthine dehydrogenase molybdopterin-binding subunit B
LIIDGQIQGGVAQGIGNAFYERLAYDENGQLLTCPPAWMCRASTQDTAKRFHRSTRWA